MAAAVTVPPKVVNPIRAASAVTLAHQLAQVQLTGRSHVRGPRVAQMGVVGPDHDLPGAGGAREVGRQGVQRLHHVAVAQVP
jgi:hypothetical protein